MSNLNALQIKNDEFRRDLIENHQKAIVNGGMPQVFLTEGVTSYYDSDQPFFFEIIKTVINFPEESFTEENDPHKEHDMAFFDVRGERFFFKIDYYDVNFEYHCGEENMLNDELCKRVLTVACAHEY